MKTWLIGGLLVAVLALAALTLHGLRGDGARSVPGAATVPGARTSDPARAAAPVETPPWKPAGVGSALPPGTVPVSTVNPPAPDPDMPMPPPPVEPPNPAVFRPSTDNPGGVDGDRPARAVPGVD